MDMHQFIRDPLLVILLLASLVSWVIIVDRLLALLQAAREDQAFHRGQATPDAPLILLQAEARRHTRADREQLLVVLDTTILLQRHRLERGLPLLGVIGSTAPYAGLLGTVIGILQAFISMQSHNNMSPAIVAGGIASALIATAVGLAVAIPAVAAHHLFMAAINRRIANWEATVAHWLPDESLKEEQYEPVTLRQG